MLEDRDYRMLRRYLSGRTLPWWQVSRLERRLLADGDFFELAGAVEDDLLDACVRRELPERERRRVLERLARSPRGREKLATARALDSLLVPPRPVRAAAPRRPFFERAVFRTALAAGLAALVAGGAYWNLFPPFAPIEPGQEVDAGRRLPRTEPPPPPAWALEPVPPRPQAPAGPAPRIAVFTLSLIALRGEEGGIEEIEVPPGTDRIDLRLDLADEPYETFRAVIVGRGEEVWTEERLRRREGRLVLRIPASRLPTGRYELSVEGLLPAGGAELVSFQELEVILR